MTVRTRFIDDALGNAAQTCGQVVLLGAGLDTRALRLRWPRGTTVFEVDTAAVLEFKDTVLREAGINPPAHCARRVPVIADASQGLHGPLCEAGHRSSRPTAWVAEGLLLYLSAEYNEHLITEVSTLSPLGSRLVLTLTPPGQHARDDAAADQGRGWRNPYRVSDGPADPQRWLAGHGWRGEPIHPGQVALAYGRAPSPDDGTDRPPRRHLIDAHRTA